MIAAQKIQPSMRGCGFFTKIFQLKKSLSNNTKILPWHEGRKYNYVATVVLQLIQSWFQSTATLVPTHLHLAVWFSLSNFQKQPSCDRETKPQHCMRNTLHLWEAASIDPYDLCQQCLNLVKRHCGLHKNSCFSSSCTYTDTWLEEEVYW